MQSFVPRKDLYFHNNGDSWSVLRRLPNQPQLVFSAHMKHLFDLLTETKNKQTFFEEVRRDELYREVSQSQLESLIQSFNQHQLFESSSIQEERSKFFKQVLKEKQNHFPIQEDFLDFPKVQIPNQTNRFTSVKGMLLPHGHLKLTSPQVAKALGTLTPDTWPDLFVILGTSHYERGVHANLNDLLLQQEVIQNDPFFLKDLESRTDIQIQKNSPWSYLEHSWQIFLPLFLQRAHEISRKLRVLPMFMSRISHQQSSQLANALLENSIYQNKKICLVASGDLTHLGQGYRPNPWISHSTQMTRIEVGEEILQHEKPFLNAIGDGDLAFFKKHFEQNSFCAKSHLITLMEFCQFHPGVVLHHETFLNFEKRKKQTWSKPFSSADQFFGTATLVFGAEKPKGLRRKKTPFLHPRVDVKIQADKAHVQNPINLIQIGLPMDFAPVIETLKHATPSNQYLFKILDQFSNKTVDPSIIEVLLQKLKITGIADQSYEDFKQRQQQLAVEKFNQISANVPFYSGLQIKQLDELPILNSNQIKKKWAQFFVSSFDWEKKIENKKKYYRRKTSGSSGAPLTTVVEQPLADKRELLGAVLMGTPQTSKQFVINRPANFFKKEDYQKFKKWPAQKKAYLSLQVSPGLNVTSLSNEALDQTIEKMIAFDPGHIHGAPEYVAAVARRMVELNIALEKISYVDLGHNYLWKPHEDIIRRAFGCPVQTRLHSSELGPIAVPCSLGFHHLVENHRVVEMLDEKNRPIKVGQMGRLVITTYLSEIRPMFRYDLGDVVKFLAEECECGRPFRTVMFQGRAKDIVRVKKKWISMINVNQLLEDIAPHFFFQAKILPNSVDLQICFHGSSKLFPKSELRDRFEFLYQRKTRVRFVQEIKYNTHGKLLGLINKDLKNSYLAKIQSGY